MHRQPRGDDRLRDSAVAVIGIACTFPGARNAEEYWWNIIHKVSAVGDMPAGRFRSATLIGDRSKAEALRCTKGGFIGDRFAFNPVRFGIAPSAITGSEPDQFLILRTVDEALLDAGRQQEYIDHSRMSFILGKGNYPSPGMAAQMYRSVVTPEFIGLLRELRPELDERALDEIRQAIGARLPVLHAETAAGLIPNLSTGRTAGRLDLMGRNFTVDAACASALVAVELAIHELRLDCSDVVLAGGSHLWLDVPLLRVLNAVEALSPSSTIRPYDERADGTVGAEGIGILVLKRLGDAERDGDRIYAVIRGVGTSSDGRASGALTPSTAGQELALRRAYAQSGIPPHTIELIEGHGTATAVGDSTELEALSSVLNAGGGEHPRCALGSVKSMIGHAMPAAGAAGLIKTVLALYERILPPTINCDRPQAQLRSPGSRLYVNSETRPWIHSQTAGPRRAGVSAFGFGGVNAHVVVEEYLGKDPSRWDTIRRRWDSELIVLGAKSLDDLRAATHGLQTFLRSAPDVPLRDVAFDCAVAGANAAERLGIVARDGVDLVEKLGIAHELLTRSEVAEIADSRGIYHTTRPLGRVGKLAMLFPGEGAQRVNMLAELCQLFPEVRDVFDDADGLAPRVDGLSLGALIYPPPLSTDADKQAASGRLVMADAAVPALLAAECGLLKLLSRLRLGADMVAGHSGGEWAALVCSGVVDQPELFARMQSLCGVFNDARRDSRFPSVAVLAVGAERARVEEALRAGRHDAYVACDNAPHQVVIVTAIHEEKSVTELLTGHNMLVYRLGHDRGYHTPAFEAFAAGLEGFLSTIQFKQPRVPHFSCMSAAPHADRPDEIRRAIVESLCRPVEFRRTIEAMYEAGARVFVEVGPGGGLSSLVTDTLGRREHLAVSIDRAARPGLSSLLHALGQLAAHHVPLELTALFARRNPQRLEAAAAVTKPAAADAAAGTVEVSCSWPKLTGGVSDKGRGSRHAAAPTQPSANGERSVLQTAAVLDPIAGEVGGASTDPVLEQHFALMRQILGSHEAIMKAALGAAAPAGAPIAPGVGSRATEESGASAVQVLAPPRPRVEEPRTPRAVPEASDPTEVLISVISRCTGYPVAMLGLDVDVETDLGIDSLKRHEILGALRDLRGSDDGSSVTRGEEFVRLRTIREMSVFLKKHHGDGTGADLSESS